MQASASSRGLPSSSLKVVLNPNVYLGRTACLVLLVVLSYTVGHFLITLKTFAGSNHGTFSESRIMLEHSSCSVNLCWRDTLITSFQFILPVLLILLLLLIFSNIYFSCKLKVFSLSFQGAWSDSLVNWFWLFAWLCPKWVHTWKKWGYWVSCFLQAQISHTTLPCREMWSQTFAGPEAPIYY